MIATDTSSIVAFWAGEKSADTGAVRNAIISSELYLPPVVIAELLSDPAISAKAELFVLDMPVLEVSKGFWARAGKTRAIILQHGHKAKLADTFIAQSCIDYNVPLITRDADFRHYAKHCGLKLYA